MPERAERDAKRDALDKLWRSHLARAQAGRFSRRPGQRLDSLAALDEAARIAREVGVPAEGMDELRNEAIACLALPDLRPGTTSVAVPPGTCRHRFRPGLPAICVERREGRHQRFPSSATTGRSFACPASAGRLVALLLSPDGRFVAGVSLRRAPGLGRGRGPAGLPAAPAGPLTESIQRGQQPAGGRSARRLDRRVGPGDGPARPDRLRTGIAPDTFAFHPDGRQLAVGYGERAAVVEIWDIDSGKKVTELPAGDAGSVLRPRLAPGRPSAGARFRWTRGPGPDLGRGRASGSWSTLESHAQWVGGMAFHPGGDLLVSRFGGRHEPAVGRQDGPAAGQLARRHRRPALQPGRDGVRVRRHRSDRRG